MITHHEKTYSIYFGDTQQSVPSPGEENFREEPFESLQRAWGLDRLVVVRQEHGIKSVVVRADSSVLEQPRFSVIADALITDRRSYALGVLTADCLPIVLYDVHFEVIAVIHAGWRGTVSAIVPSVLFQMKHHFGSSPKNITAYFGPSAQSCCYEVQNDFLTTLNESTIASYVSERDGKWFFDVSQMNQQQLLAAGVPEDRICRQHNICTICNKQFNSYRRDRKKAGRQITAAILK